MSLRRPTVAFLFKALSAMSVRRPTVAFLLKALYVVSLRCPTVASFSLFLFVHLSRRRFRHPIGPYLCSVEFQADYRRFPFYLPVMPILFIVH